MTAFVSRSFSDSEKTRKQAKSCGRRQTNLEAWANEIVPDCFQFLVAPFASYGSILNQILRPIQSLPQRLKSVRIISFAFLLDGSISKAAHRGTKTFDCIVPETKGFPQSVFQRFSFCIECLLSRRRNCNASHLRENHAESLQHAPSTQTALL